MVLSLVVICYMFQIKAGNCGLCHYPYFLHYKLFVGIFFYLWVLHCLFILIGDFVLDAEGTALNLAGGSLNVLPDLSLFTLVFICTLPAWPMGAYAFCLSCPGFLIVGVESISTSICSIFLNLFFVFIGGFGVGFWFSSFSLVLEVDLCLLFIACISFFFFCLWLLGCCLVYWLGVFSTWGIVVFRVLIRFCSSFKFINSSSIFLVFIWVFIWFSFEESFCFWEANILGDFNF